MYVSSTLPTQVRVMFGMISKALLESSVVIAAIVVMLVLKNKMLMTPSISIQDRDSTDLEKIQRIVFEEQPHWKEQL
jgi:hypothetical protein